MAESVRSKGPDLEGKARRAKEVLPELYEFLDPCRLCPRKCGARRQHRELGECGIGDELRVASIGLHHGNEFPISGVNGSGNIFLSGCNLHCVYCQNWTISQSREGRSMTPGELAGEMLRLQQAGAHNINCVTPTHVIPMLLEALIQAWEQGLDLPFVYNTGGYDSVEVLKRLEGMVDVYLPDMKYGEADVGRRLSDVEDYPMHNQDAVREMHRQVGPLQRSEQGVAVRGLLVRHLVLPNGLAGCERVFDFLERDLPGVVHVNVMDQYHPAYRAGTNPTIARPVHSGEYEEAVRLARERPSLKLIE